LESQRIKKLQDIVYEYEKNGYFKDASFFLFSSDKAFGGGTCGTADFTTWFDLASLTKLFTSTVILSLIQKGDLKLEDKAGSFFKDVNSGVLRERLCDISIRQLLTHTSGLIPWFPFYTRQGSVFQILEEIVCQNPFLEGMHYSDLNFILLGMIGERVVGKSLPDMMKSKLFAPLSIGDVSYLPKGVCKKREELIGEGKIALSCYGNQIEEEMCRERGFSFSHFRERGFPVIGEANDGNCWYYMKGVSGHAGLFGPVTALVKLGQFYLKENNSIFREAMKDWGFERGLGFEMGDKYPEGCGHTGFTGTSLWISEKNNRGMAIVTNRLACDKGGKAKDLKEFRKLMHETALY
jgi:CubicO group peptidase (beta-lactamase class C family)